MVDTSKVLIAIVSCKKNADRVAAMRATWIPRAIAAGYDVQIFDGERLNVDDSYTGFTNKVRAVYQFAEAGSYERMLKSDDDTYIRVEKLEPVLADYAGIMNNANDGGYHMVDGKTVYCNDRHHGPDVIGVPAVLRGTYPHPYCSGGAYWVSRRTIEIIAKTPLNGDWAEDRWVGDSLAKASDIKVTDLSRLGYDWVCNRSLTPRFSPNLIVLTQLAKPEDQFTCDKIYGPGGVHGPAKI